MGGEEKGLKWDKWVSAPAEQGNLEMLKYCFEHGCPLDDYTAICAAHNGHLRSLKFLIEDAKVDWYDQSERAQRRRRTSRDLAVLCF